MDACVEARAREVLISNCSSNDDEKRNAAAAILSSTELFELFCKAVVVRTRVAKINQK